MLTLGERGEALAHALAPWVGAVEIDGSRVQAGSVDWVFVTADSPRGRPGLHEGLGSQLRLAFAFLRAGGRVALTCENRWGLHWLADWRAEGSAGRDARSLRSRGGHGFGWHRRAMRQAGGGEVHCFALLPSSDAPRAIIPVDPPCPAAAQRMALDQIWQRASPSAAIVRAGLGVLLHAGLMRSLYPHYLVIGRRPC